MKKILIVEDDKSLREGLYKSLRTDEIITFSASNISEAYKIFSSENIDLIILDCNLPDGNGVDFCFEIKKSNTVPVIFLTVLDSELDEVTAFRAGGCDYIKKPFSLMVLCERVKSVLERTGYNNMIYNDGKYYLDFYNIIFKFDNNDLILSATEQKLLHILVENKNRIMSRTLLMEKIWSCDSDFIDENALSVSVKRLRSKLGNNCIKTVYGLGYMWVGDKK